MEKDISKDYTRQINRVIDFIHDNLDRTISLEELAAQTNLSSSHFHRIFTSVVGEPLGKYVTRKRLERVANSLRDTELPLKDVAYRWGFSSVPLLCRNFKRYFGCTPGEFRSKNGQPDSKNNQFKSINENHTSVYSRYFCREKSIKTGGKIMNCTFEIRQQPSINIIYCRYIGAYDQMQGAFARLMQWAYPRGLMAAPEMRLLSVYHDDPRTTDASQLTSDAGMIVASDVKTDGEIGKMSLTGGLYAVGRFEIAMQEFSAAWMAMFDLIAENGCCCTDGHHYEIYQNNHEEHPQKKFIVDICIPVKPV